MTQYEIDKIDYLVGEQPFDYDKVGNVSSKKGRIVERVALNGEPDESLENEPLLREITLLSETEEPKIQEEEAEFLCGINDPLLPDVKGVFAGIVDGRKVFSIVQREVDGLYLEDVVSGTDGLKVEDALSYTDQIISALEYLHQAGYSSKDVNPSNLLIDEDSPDYLRLAEIRNLRKISASEDKEAIDGWAHPGEEKVDLDLKKDLFVAGTSLYFMLTGRKAKIETVDEPDEKSDKEVRLSEECLKVFGDKFKDTAGGPELLRTVKKLVSPSKKARYDSVDSLRSDIGKLETIFKDGYEALKDKNFPVERESGFQQAGKAVSSMGKSFGERLSGITDFFTGVYSWVTGDVFRFCVAGGAVLGLGIGGFVANRMENQVVRKPVFFAPMYDVDAHPAVRVSAGVSDLSNEIRALYIDLAGENGEVPNEIVVRQEIDDISGKTDEVLGAMEELRNDMRRFIDPVNEIRAGGREVRNSFQYRREGTQSHKEDTWTFMASRANQGVQLLIEGLSALEGLESTSIPLADYVRPGKSEDDLGRQINFIAQTAGDVNEWIKHGLVPSFNYLNSPDGNIWSSGFVRELLEDYGEGEGLLHNRVKYPGVKKARKKANKDDDEVGAPRGYVVTKRVGQTTEEYAQHNIRIQTFLRQNEIHLGKLGRELRRLSYKLGEGSSIDEDNLAEAVDLSSMAYRVMVPETKVMPPTIADKHAYSFGIGGGIFLAFSLLGLGINLYNKHSNPWGGGYSSYPGGRYFGRRRPYGW